MAAKKIEKTVSVRVRCIGCRAEREVKAGEVKAGDHPMCEKCFMPTVPVEARAK